MDQSYDWPLLTSRSMPGYLKRLLELYQRAGIDYVLVRGVPWRVYQRMIVPVGPACQDYTISRDEQQQLLAHFKKAILLRYTDGFQPAEDEPRWYAVTCQAFRDLEDYGANLRHHIRRGLKRCMVSKVDAHYMAEKGYPVHMAAYARYKGTAAPNMTEAEWKRGFLHVGDFPDLREYWGVFVDKQFAGYIAVQLFDKIEVNYAAGKWDPGFSNAYPFYALFHRMGEYYLREQSFQYANAGFRTISHETHVQEFLIHKFNFQKTPLHLHVQYRPWTAAALALPRFARRWLGKWVPHYADLCLLSDVKTSCRKANQ